MSTCRTVSCLLTVSLLMSPLVPAAEQVTGFALQDDPGKHLDVLLDGKIAARYQYEYDTTSKEQTLATYKPYLHIFNAAGTAPITKGPGGEFPHHRGIFIGWCKIRHADKTQDLWHMKSAAIIHQRFTTQEANVDQARIVAEITWTTLNPAAVVLSEQRTFTFRRSPVGRFTVDQQSRLTASTGEVVLDGDPEHAGMQFRPAAEVLSPETVYALPRAQANPSKDRDYPWVGCTFALPNERHSVVIMNHPNNPTGTRFSAYRHYGRFGAFPTLTIAANASATLSYRFLIAAGDLPAVEGIQRSWDEFAGATSPSAVPMVTIRPADPAKPAKAEAPKAPPKDAPTAP